MPTTMTGLLRGAVALGCALTLAGCSTSAPAENSSPSDQTSSAGATASAKASPSAPPPAQAAVNKSTPPRAMTSEDLAAAIDKLKSRLSSNPIKLPEQVLPNDPSSIPGLKFSVTPSGCTASAFDHARPHSTNAAVTAGLSVSFPTRGSGKAGASYLVQISVLPDVDRADGFINQQIEQAENCQDFKFEQAQATSVFTLDTTGEGTVKVLDLPTDADRSFTSTTSSTNIQTITSQSQTAPPTPLTNETVRLSTIGRVGNVLFVVWGLKIENPQEEPNPDTVKEVFNLAVHTVFD
jgi:hypothetical protein